MMVTQVEYQRLSNPNQDGVRVTFTYDCSELMDRFDVYDQDAQVVLNMIASKPDPTYLLTALRDLTNVTVH